VYGPGLSRAGENGKTRASLYATKDGPGLGLFDKNSRILRSLP
jgi:hypothetical protein